MDVALGVIVILLAMPGVLVSLLLFEKYGSLIRWMRGDGVFDPFVATMPDEYFFIVLSMVVTGAAAVWRWDALFLDRRDYTNIVPLPVSLRRIFLGNLAAILLLAAALTLDVNAASFVLFPVAVVGSQVSLGVFLQFAAGHAATVVLASAFSFFAVFAVIGLLMALLPYALFRRISLYVRFLIALFLIALLATSFAVTSFLGQLAGISKFAVNLLPPVWFLGIGQTLWGNGHNPFFAALTRTALFALGVSLAVAILSYALSFRRSFIRIQKPLKSVPSRARNFIFSPLISSTEASFAIRHNAPASTSSHERFSAAKRIYRSCPPLSPWRSSFPHKPSLRLFIRTPRRWCAIPPKIFSPSHLS